MISRSAAGRPDSDDRQNLRKIGGLPGDTAQMMGIHEIKALLVAQCQEVALRPGHLRHAPRLCILPHRP
jgi:hypothetical protein